MAIYLLFVFLQTSFYFLQLVKKLRFEHLQANLARVSLAMRKEKLLNNLA